MASSEQVRGPQSAQQTRRAQTFTERSKALIRVLFFTRFSVLFGCVLLFLAAMPFVFSTPAITSVYIQDAQWRVFHLTWLCVLAAALVVQTFRVTICNAKGRFDDTGVYLFWESPPEWLWKLRSVSVWLLSLPLPIASIWVTLQANAQHETGLRFRISPWLEMAGGILVAATVLCLVDVINRFLLTPNLHDPRLFVLDYRFLFWTRRNPRDWKRNRENEEARSMPLKPARVGYWNTLIRVARVLRLTHGYTHQIGVWAQRREDDAADGPEFITREFFLPGHVMLGCLSSVLIAVYVGAYLGVHYSQAMPDEDAAFGTLFYLVGIVMMFTGGLPALAFYFDRYRIPPGLVLAAVLAFLSLVWPGTAPHEFPVSPPMQAVSGAAVDSRLAAPDASFRHKPLRVREVVEGWSKRQEFVASRTGLPKSRTFVVVTAAGGGIQASAWTSQVLTGLQQSLDDLSAGEGSKQSVRTGLRFAASIGLISGVSGGSVGALQYAAGYPEAISAEPVGARDVLSYIHAQASRSSLESIGWGFFFPDAMRVLGVNRNPLFDRGQVQEQLWASRMQPPPKADRSWSLLNTAEPLVGGSGPAALANGGAAGQSETLRGDWRLGHLAHRVATGSLPAIIFNSYVINTGQRVLIAPLVLSPAQENDAEGADEQHNTFEYLEYSRALGMQLRLATAARLSATFPYISPTVTSDHPVSRTEYAGSKLTRSAILLRNGHLADGGFTDNEGLLAALRFIEYLRIAYDDDPGRPFDDVLLLRIVPFPMSKPSTDLGLGATTRLWRDSTWKQSLIGPAVGIYNGRSTSQRERGALDIDNLERIVELTSQRTENGAGPNQPAQSPLAYRKDMLINPLRAREAGRGEQGRKPIQIKSVVADFRYPKKATQGSSARDAVDRRTPPLSWKLSRSEKVDIEKAWKSWQTELATDMPGGMSNLHHVRALIKPMDESRSN